MKKIIYIILGIILCVLNIESTFAKGVYKEIDRGVVYITDETKQIPYLNSNNRSLYNAEGTWHEDTNGWWFEYSGGGHPSSTWEEIDSYWYYFNDMGYMVTGWIQVKDKWYFCETSDQVEAPHGSMITGWRKIKDDWYFFETAGTNERPLGSMITGKLQIGVKSYYFRTSKGISTDGQEHPEGSMIVSMYGEDEGEKVYYNSQGEKCKILSNKDKAIYTLLGNDGTIDGGYVNWNLEAFLSNETENEVKVTDRIATCTYFHPNTFGASFDLGSIPREHSEYENKFVDLKWNSMDFVYPSQETLVFSIENHYDIENPTKGDNNFFKRNTDYELVFTYLYGLPQDSAGVGTVKLENAGITEGLYGVKDIRPVRVSYGNVAADYSVSDSSIEELKDIYTIVEKIDLIKNPLVYMQNEENKSDNILNTVYVNKDSLDKLVQNCKLMGEENAEKKAREFAIMEAILYGESKINNIFINESDILNYRELLIKELKLEENQMYQKLVSSCGGEDLYWNITNENYKIKLAIDKYLLNLKEEFYKDNKYENNILEYEQQWNKYIKNTINQLKTKYKIIIE